MRSDLSPALTKKLYANVHLRCLMGNMSVG